LVLKVKILIWDWVWKVYVFSGISGDYWRIWFALKEIQKPLEN
jgi:hypothetical protein